MPISFSISILSIHYHTSYCFRDGEVLSAKEGPSSAEWSRGSRLHSVTVQRCSFLMIRVRKRKKEGSARWWSNLSDKSKRRRWGQSHFVGQLKSRLRRVANFLSAPCSRATWVSISIIPLIWDLSAKFCIVQSTGQVLANFEILSCSLVTANVITGVNIME